MTPKATYRLSIWAKGKGQLNLAVYQSSAAGFVGTAFLKPLFALKPEWQQLTVTYRTDDSRVRSGALAVHLYGRDSVAWFDDASFSFNPEENPSMTIDSDRPGTRKLAFAVTARDAAVTLFVQGVPVPISDDAATAEITEGLVPVAAWARPTGTSLALSVRIVGHAESDARWRMNTAEQPGWTSTEFDDHAWPVAGCGATTRSVSTTRRSQPEPRWSCG